MPSSVVLSVLFVHFPQPGWNAIYSKCTSWRPQRQRIFWTAGLLAKVYVVGELWLGSGEGAGCCWGRVLAPCAMVGLMGGTVPVRGAFAFSTAWVPLGLHCGLGWLNFMPALGCTPRIGQLRELFCHLPIAHRSALSKDLHQLCSGGGMWHVVLAPSHCLAAV